MIRTRLFFTLLLLLCLALSVFLTGCSGLFPSVDGTLPDTGGGNDGTDNGNNGSTGTDDSGNDSGNNKHDEGEYTVTFVMGPSRIVHYYDEGDIIDPPTFDRYEMDYYFIVFNGWESEFAPVTGNVTYKALYYDYKDYTATFVMGDQTVEVETQYGTAAKAPESIPDYNGMTFVFWDKSIDISSVDVTYTAVYCDESIIDKEGFSLAYKYSLIEYASTSSGDSSSRYLKMAMALYTLAYHEHLNPQGGAVAKRINAHFDNVVTKDKAPPIDASTNWGYNPLQASIALARVTPTVWDTMDPATTLRINTLMRAFAYLGSFSTSDYNSYQTGPGMNGNYAKTWNPNYRLGNIPVMVYTVYFFGNGDIEKGAEQVNAYLKEFDEDVYDKLVNTFQQYGWRRAFQTWTQEGRTATNGTGIVGKSAKELLCHGGQAVGEDTSTASDLLVALGTGVGVNNGGKDYLYLGYSLYQPEQIIRHLVNYNYGGTGSRGTIGSTDFKKVVSDHWYDITGDKVKDLVAYIVDGTSSPYEGEYGMMTEFASGNRSSTGYCSHDFVLTTALLSCASAMERYTTDEDGNRVLMTDDEGNPVVVLDYTEDEEFWHRIQIGNEDLIYKAIHGYQCYATGSYGTSSSIGYESTGADYVLAKHLWRTGMLPRGTVQTAESYG